MRPYHYRVKWMKLMGFSEKEIKRSVHQNPPINYDEEKEEYEAALKLQELNKTIDWDKIRNECVRKT